MSGEAMLRHAATVVAERSRAYGAPAGSMELLAKRWSITLGRTVTPAQAVMCLIDLKLTRLACKFACNNDPLRGCFRVQ